MADEYNEVLWDACAYNETIAERISEALGEAIDYIHNLNNHYKMPKEVPTPPNPLPMRQAAQKLETARQEARALLLLARDRSYELDRAWRTLLSSFDRSTGDADAFCAIWNQKAFFKQRGLPISAAVSPFKHFITKLNECEVKILRQTDWYERKMQKIDTWIHEDRLLRAPESNVFDIISEIEYEFENAMHPQVGLFTP